MKQSTPSERKKSNNQPLKRVPAMAWAVGGGAMLALIVGAILIVILNGQASSPSPTPRPPTSPPETRPPTPSLTPAPTETPKGATVTPATQATPTQPRASSITQASATTPTLMAPEQGRTYEGPITFQWQGALETGQSYQIRAWHIESDTVIQSPLLSRTDWTTTLPAEQAGEWHWEVSVHGDGSLLVTSNEGMFWFNPFASPGEGNGGGGGGESPLATPDDR